MTAASYTWQRWQSMLKNPSFNFSIIWTDWSTTGTVNRLTGGTSYDGDSPELTVGSSIIQILTMTAGATGRWVDKNHDLRLAFRASVTAGTPDKFEVRFLLYDASTVYKYYYDFMKEAWVSVASGAVATDAPSWGLYVSGAAWTQYVLPRILAPAEAGNDVADGWKVRVLFANNTENDAAAKVAIDDASLTDWASMGRAAAVGSYGVLYNGVNYPVKYNPRLAEVSELSLHPPYATPNSPLPTVTTATTGGSLPRSTYFGYIYLFLNLSSGERSALPLGVLSSTAVYTQATGSTTDTNTISHNFSAIKIPNTESARTTDDARVTHIVLFRTKGATDAIHGDGQAQAEADAQAGNVYYETTIAVNATAVSSINDEDLEQQGGLSDFFADPTQDPAPMFDVAMTWRSRLWCAGGPDIRFGSVNVTVGSRVVTGVNTGHATNAPTRWGRFVVGYTFRLSSGISEYDVEEYYYPSDNGTSSSEAIYLTETYKEATLAVQDGVLRPKGGRVFFCEEGRPWAFGVSNFILLDGDQSGRVTMIIQGGNAAIFATRTDTYGLSYVVYPTESGNTAPALRRGVGCIGSASAAECNGLAYWLSDQGVARSDGSTVEIISAGLRRLFVDREDADYVLRRRVDGMAIHAHGVHYPNRNQYLLAVKTRDGARQGADLVLVYNYLLDTWDTYRMRLGITGWSWVNDDAGNPTLMFSDAYGGLWKWDIGYVDGAGENNNHGRLYGRVESSTDLSAVLADTNVLWTGGSSKNFSSAVLDLENAVIRIVAGTGSGQERRIARSDLTTVFIDRVWDTNPDTTSVWELGGMDCKLNLKPSDFEAPAQIKTMKHLHVDLDRQDLAADVAVEVRIEDLDETWHAIKDAADKLFNTGGAGRSIVGLSDAAGYLVRLSLNASGVQKPMRIRGLGLVHTTSPGGK